MSHSFLKNMMELLVHHYNESSAISREAAARGDGLPNPERFAHPYPGSTNNFFLIGNQTGQPTAPPLVPLPPTTPSAPATKPKWDWSRWLPLIILLVFLGGLVALWLVYGTPTPADHEHTKAVLEQSKDGGKTWTPVPIAR